MVDLQELKRLAELPGDIGRTELAFWMADHAHEFIAEVESLRRQLEEAQYEAARWRYIEEHATSYGGGHGFTITCFVPVDHEDMGCGIDSVLAQVKEQKK